MFNCFEILVKKIFGTFSGCSEFSRVLFRNFDEKIRCVFIVFRISARFHSVQLSKTHTEFQLSRNLSEKNFGAFSECPGYQNLRRISIVSKFL